MVEPVTYGAPAKKASVPPLFTGVRGKGVLGSWSGPLPRSATPLGPYFGPQARERKRAHGLRVQRGLRSTISPAHSLRPIALVPRGAGISEEPGMERTVVDNRYALSGLLGAGGMGKVYLACDRVLDRDVALKVLREQCAEDEEFVERFGREAKAAASLNHPHIVSVYDRGRTEDGTYYIAMEHVPGGTLKDRILKGGPLDPAAAVRTGAQVAAALGVAHASGIVHRDVKPQNVLLTASGDAKVADFGIARAASEASLSDGSLVLGTAKYMSPEQAMGDQVGPESDLYSLGVVLYEMLTGEGPLEADSAAGAARRTATGAPRPPKEANPGIPEALNGVVLRLLQKRPEDRYPGAAELVEDLRRAGEGLYQVFGAAPDPRAGGAGARRGRAA